MRAKNNAKPETLVLVLGNALLAVTLSAIALTWEYDFLALVLFFYPCFIAITVHSRLRKNAKIGAGQIALRSAPTVWEVAIIVSYIVGLSMFTLGALYADAAHALYFAVVLLICALGPMTGIWIAEFVASRRRASV